MKYNIRGLYIEITSNCNLKCKHCYNNSGEEVVDIPFDVLENIVIESLELGITHFTISGGEPLTRKDLIDIIKLILKNDCTTMSIVTNGMLITQEFLCEIKRFLNKNERLHFQISVDGCDAPSHDYLRGEGSFEILTRKLELLKNSGFFISFHTVLHSRNYRKVENIIDYAIHNQVDNVAFAFLKKKGRGDDFYADLAICIDTEMELIKEFQEMKKKYSKYKLSFPEVFYGKCPIFEGEEPELFIRIDAKGNLYPCQNFGGCDSVLGNVKKNKIKDIVVEENLLVLYNKIINKREQTRTCSNCLAKGVCGKGCLGVEFCDDYDDLYSNECLLRRKYFLEQLGSVFYEIIERDKV